MWQVLPDLMQVGPEEGSLADMRRMDAELFRLARGAGMVRLRIGQALARMDEGYRELGFSTLGRYALERCSRKGRWAQESRALAKRLQELPHLHAAVEKGDIGWSMAELLARHATPEDEAALLEQALTKTVRAMKESLRAACTATGDATAARDATADSVDDASVDDAAAGAELQSADSNRELDEKEEQPRRRTLTLSVPIEEAYMLDAVRRLVEHIDGCSSSGDWFEALLAEGQGSLMDQLPADAELLPADVVAQHQAWLERVEEAEASRRAAEARAEARLPRQGHEFGALDGKPDEADLPEELAALDQRIRQWSQELASRDLWFGKLVERFLGLHGWRSLGYANETQYARERLGMSRAAMRGKLGLARKTRWLQQTARALERGAIGYEAAALVARVASVDTETAWLERAERRTFKHLREEVEAAEWVARLSPGTRVGELHPPTDEQLSWVQDAEREILSGEVLRRAALDANAAHCAEASDACGSAANDTQDGPVNGGPTPVAVGMEAEQTGVQISVSGEGHGAYTTVRIWMDEETALHFRQLEETFRRRAPGQSFIRFMCIAFFRAWARTLGQSDKWEAIYRRDLYRCTNPVCDRRDVTLHHTLYRSRGGGDKPPNLTSPCELCRYRHKLHYAACRIMPTLMAA